MKRFTILLAMLFALSVNMAPAMADSDEHHGYKQHEKKHEHDRSSHEDDEGYQREQRHDDRDKQAMSREYRAAEKVGTDNQRHPVRRRNMPDWWPF